MPKAPILARTAFYTRLRDGSIRPIDLRLVTTTLGAMVEWPSLRDRANIQQEDVYDTNLTEIKETEPDTFFTRYNSDGLSWPATFNTL